VIDPPRNATIARMIASAALLVALLGQNTTSAATAGAEPAMTTMRLEVFAAATCTSRDDLVVRIEARSPRIAIVEHASVAARVAVVSQRPGNVVADLVFSTGNTEQPPRRVIARSCAEIADAVALIIVVTLDPNLKHKAATAPVPGTAGDADSNAGPATMTGPPTATATVPPSNDPTTLPPTTRPDEGPARATRPASLSRPQPAAQPTAGATPPSKSEAQLGISLAGQAIFGPTPNPMPGVALYAMGAWERDGAWAPALFVGATHVWRDDLSQRGGKASFALDAASFDVCPMRLRRSPFTARPCASALVGRVTAQGSDTDHPAHSARPFAAAGAAITATVGSTVELSARLGVGVTLIRDSYDFAGSVFHRAAPLTVSASIGIGTHWP